MSSVERVGRDQRWMEGRRNSTSKNGCVSTNRRMVGFEYDPCFAVFVLPLAAPAPVCTSTYTRLVILFFLLLGYGKLKESGVVYRNTTRFDASPVVYFVCSSSIYDIYDIYDTTIVFFSRSDPYPYPASPPPYPHIQTYLA